MVTAKPVPSALFILSRPGLDGAPRYVREKPGQGGKDWGYVTEAAKAVPVSAYWKRRFEADMRRCGVTPSVVTVTFS